MVAHLLPRGALLLAALVARAAAQGAPQGDAASDTAALLGTSKAERRKARQG